MGLTIDIHLHDAWSPEARVAAAQARKAHSSAPAAVPVATKSNIVTAKAPKPKPAPLTPKPRPIANVVYARTPQAIAKAKRIAKIPHGVTR